MQLKVLKTVGIISGVAGLLMAFAAVMAPFVSPDILWLLAFFGLAYPFIFLANIVLTVVLLFFRSKGYWFSLGAICLMLGNIPSFIQFVPEETSPKTESQINVVSFNTHYMGVYDYQGGDTNYFFNMLDTLKPDIICFQEFANMGGDYEMPMFKKFFRKYKNFQAVNADPLSLNFPTGYGVSIFSKYPIVNKGFLELENQSSNLTIFADIVCGSDTIRVVNTHLKSIVFDKEDYRTVEELKKADDGPQTDKIRRIIAKLKYAFLFRARQAEKVREKLMLSPYKVIVCGDFNDSPTSYAYHTIRGDLKDAFKESGKGMSRTYVGKMPSFRIDYILHHPSWESYNYKTNILNFSDHKMVSCTIKIR